MLAPSTLHLIDTGGPGGAETVFLELATRLHQRPLRSLPVVPREGWLSRELRTRGLSPTIIASRGSINAAYLWRLMEHARVEKVRLIHAHLLGSSIYGALASIARRVPVVAVFHGPTDVRDPGKLALVKRVLIRSRCTRIVAVSRGTRNALVAFGVPEPSIALIPNGVDTTVFYPCQDTTLRRELGLGMQDILIGALGNIRPTKGYDVLLRAAKLLAARVPQAHVAVVGDGDDETLRALRQQRDALGLADRFHFLGFRKSTPRLLANLDVFVSSSRSEGLPLSILEAMACGACIVATESGGPQEVLVNEKSGITVPIEDPAALAAALERAVTDLSLRRRLGTAALEHVRAEFSLDLTVNRYAELYTDLLSREGIAPENRGVQSSGDEA